MIGYSPPLHSLMFLKDCRSRLMSTQINSWKMHGRIDGWKQFLVKTYYPLTIILTALMYIILFICKDRSYPLFSKMRTLKFRVLSWWVIQLTSDRGGSFVCLTLNPDGPALFITAQFTFFFFTLDYQKSMENTPGFLCWSLAWKNIKGKDE